MQNKFSVKLTIILLLMLTISLGVVVAATITIPVRIHQQRQSLCIDSDYMSGKLADINQLNCLNSGNPFNSKYGVGKIYVKSLSNDTGLILHLTFDDCSIEDLSGLKNTPTENNVTCVNSIFGKGMKFNGIDSKFVLQYNPSLDSNRITISVWLKIDEITSTETIVAKSDYPSSGYFLRIGPGTNNGTKIMFFIGDSTGSSHDVIADNQNILGKWIHLVAVYNGSEQSIWIDGKKVSYINWTGDIGLNTKNLEVGDEYGSNYFDGVIDEIAIYNRGLSENEIKALFYDKLLLLTSTYDAKYMIDDSENVDENRFETEIFLNNQYYLNKTFTLEVPVPDDANASVFYPYVSGYIDIKELSGIGHGEWNYSIEKFDYGVKNRLIINATLAGADGFDNGIKDFNPDTFFYKREITINNSANSENLTDYQIKITLDTASLISQGKMNDDCGDIRFYYYDNSTGSEEKIPYWIKPGTCNTTSTEIWFKVPYIPANGIAKVYMYYGNPSAVSESNGDAVFLFFDDFDGTSLNTSKWNVYSGSIDVINGIANMSDGDKAKTYETFGNYTSIMARYRIYDLSRFPTIGIGYDHPRESLEYSMIQANGEYSYYRAEQNGSTNVLSSDGYGINIAERDTDFHLFVINRFPDKIKYYVDENTQILDRNVPAGNLSLKMYTYHDTLYPGKNVMEVDWIVVRKIVENEPTVSIGNEEINEVDEIQISTDFLKIIVNKNFYQDRSHPVSIIVNDKENNFLYEINLSDITVDDSKVYELYPNYTVYFYDWETQKWKVWEKGVNNSTHGVPNWLDPAFRQELKWRFSFENNSNTNVSLNVTFLVTAHDPFIRVFVDGSDLISNVEHNIHLSIHTKEKKYYTTILNNTFILYDSGNVSSFSVITGNSYRKPITINNSLNVQNLTDYQLAINISYNPHMQSDFDDIRFTYINSSGEYKIPYWIEQKIDGSWAYVWIKVPFIPDNNTDIGFGDGIAKVYMYYGNPSAVSESNGDAVFPFFDDFSSDPVPYFTVVDEGNRGKKYFRLSYVSDHKRIRTLAYMKDIDVSSYSPIPTFGCTNNTTDYNSAYVMFSADTDKGASGNLAMPYFRTKYEDNFSETSPTDPNIEQNNTYIVEIMYSAGEYAKINLFFDNYTLLWSDILTTNIPTKELGNMYIYAYTGGLEDGNVGYIQWLSDEKALEIYTERTFVGTKYIIDLYWWLETEYINVTSLTYHIGNEENVSKKSLPINVLIDKSSDDIALFFTESRSVFQDIESIYNEMIDMVNYVLSFENNKLNVMISLGYTDAIDTTTGNISTWTIGFSNETLEKVGNSTLTYYDIISWKKKGDYNSVQHNVSLIFHYNDTYKDDYNVGWYNYTGIEDSTSFTGNLVSNRSVNENVHRIIDAGTSSYIVFNLTDHDSISQSDYDQRRIKIVVDYPVQKATYLLLDSLDERYGIRNQNDAYIILANNDNSNQIFLSSSERGLYSFSSNKSSIKEVELNLSAFHTGLTLGYIASDMTKDSDNDNIPDLLEDEEPIGFSSSEKLTDFTKSSLGYYMLGYDGYKFIATFGYLDNEFSYTSFYLLGLKQPVGVENAYEIGYRVSNGATWYMFRSQPIAKFHLNSTSVAQTNNMIKYMTFKQKNITIYPEDELYIEGLPTTLSGEGEITYTRSNFLPKAELKLYIKYNQTMSYWVNYILPASADYLIIEISNPEKTYFSMKYNLTDHDKITIPTNNWINDYWYNINSSCYSKNDIKYGMICSDASPEEVAVALVAGYGIADSLCYTNDTKYTLSLNTTSDKIVIPLTDNCRMVVNKMRSIETYGIPTTSFNEKTAKSNYVTMTLSYDKIKVLGDLSFSNGYYRLCVRNVGREYGTTLVEIVRC